MPDLLEGTKDVVIKNVKNHIDSVEQEEQQEFLSQIKEDYDNVQKYLKQLSSQSRMKEAIEKLEATYKSQTGDLDKIEDRDERRNQAEKRLKTLFHLINRQKKSQVTSSQLLNLYHAVNKLAAKIRNKDEVQYKILFNVSLSKEDGGTERTVAEFSGSFNQAVSLGLIYVTHSGDISYGGRVVNYNRLSREQKQKYDDLVQEGLIQQAVIERKIIQNMRKRESVILNNELVADLDKGISSFRQFTYVYSYLFQETMLSNYTIGHYYETYQQLVSMKKTGFTVQDIIIAAVRAKGNDPWITGGDTIIDGTDFQVKAFGGNYTEPRQLISFAAKICADIETLKKTDPKDFHIVKEKIQKSYLQQVEKEVKHELDDTVQKYVEQIEKQFENKK